jgi:hypothetical protein
MKLKDHFDLHIVTARQFKVADITRYHSHVYCSDIFLNAFFIPFSRTFAKIWVVFRNWIDSNFPGIFSEIHFGNHYSSTGVARAKSEMCKDINALLLIDDSARYALDCAKNGIPSILFGNYAWNRHIHDALSNDTHYLTGLASTGESTHHPSVENASPLASKSGVSPLISRAGDWETVVCTILSSISLSSKTEVDVSSIADGGSNNCKDLVTFQSKLRYSFSAHYAAVSIRSDRLFVDSSDISLQRTVDNVRIDADKGESFQINSSVEVTSSLELLPGEVAALNRRLNT